MFLEDKNNSSRDVQSSGQSETLQRQRDQMIVPLEKNVNNISIHFHSQKRKLRTIDPSTSHINGC